MESRWEVSHEYRVGRGHVSVECNLRDLCPGVPVLYFIDEDGLEARWELFGTWNPFTRNAGVGYENAQSPLDWGCRPDCISLCSLESRWAYPSWRRHRWQCVLVGWYKWCTDHKAWWASRKGYERCLESLRSVPGQWQWQRRQWRVVRMGCREVFIYKRA